MDRDPAAAIRALRAMPMPDCDKASVRYLCQVDQALRARSDAPTGFRKPSSMSVRCITKVLDSSGHAGTELLMLVVLADYSDDEGNSYPAVASLARKCRMTPRNGNYILSALQASGELRVLKNEGPRGTNRYRIMLEALGVQPLKPASPLKAASPLKPTSAPPEAGFPKPLKPASDEPSLNRQEPSVSARAPVTKLPTCPHGSIVQAYHQILPELPSVRVLETKGRREGVESFWAWIFKGERVDGSKRATTAEEALTFVGKYFERARSNDFCMNRTPRPESHRNWRCDLDYLVSEKGRIQVIEKTEVPQ